MLGKTNATVGNFEKKEIAAVGGEIDVINKTGSNITSGDKIWINEIVDVDWSTYAHTYLNELSLGNETNVNLFRYDFTITELDAGGSNYTGGTATLITSSSGNVIGVYVNGVNSNNTINLAAARGNGSTWNTPSNTSSRITASLGDKISVRVKYISGYGAYIIIYNLTTGLNTGTGGGETGSIRLGTRDETDLLVRTSNTWSNTFKLKFEADKVWFSKGGLEVVDYNPDETSIKQFWAVPYNNFNKNTLTGIAKTEAEDNKTLTAIIGGDVTEVYNQDKTITENGTYTADVGYTGLGTVTVNVDTVNNQDITLNANGVYTPDEGYTGFGSVTVEVEASGGGETITAVNKTGAVINEGDKVWLQKDAQVGDTGYTVVQNQYSLSGTISFVTRSGNYAFADVNYSRGLYKLSETGATKVNSFTSNTNINCLRYMKDSTIFATDNYNGAYRIDDNGFFSIGNYFPIMDDLFFDRSNNVNRLNVIDGTVLETWQVATQTSVTKASFVIGNKVYTSNGCITLASDGQFSVVTTTGLPSSISPNGVTSDGKYVILCNDNSPKDSQSLKIYERTSETSFRFVNVNELPAEFTPFYNGASNVIAIFNPYTGILTCTVTGSNKKYLIAKYENGSWKVLSVVLPLGTAIYPIINQGITVSDDLTKVGLTTLSQSAYGGYYAFQVVNTATVAGFSGIPYNVYSFTNKTLIGKAKTSAEIGAEVEVSTVLPNEVSVEVSAEDDNVTLSME